MPAVPSSVDFFKIPPDRITFRAVAPKKEGFPIDEPDRVYAGIVKLNRDPNDISIQFAGCNGSLFLFFACAHIHTETIFIFFHNLPKFIWSSFKLLHGIGTSLLSSRPCIKDYQEQFRNA